VPAAIEDQEQAPVIDVPCLLGAVVISGREFSIIREQQVGGGAGVVAG
jgi:hypothetical protein